MRRISMEPRGDWQNIAKENGFFFHHIDGELYWDESAYYSFSLKEIEEDLEAPSNELQEMCIDLVGEACKNEEILKFLHIPSRYWDFIKDSWNEGQASIYGRFDFAYDGHGPAKLLEYNADTPTALYEASYFQWLWLEDCIKRGKLSANCDQFNSIQERLIKTFEFLQTYYHIRPANSNEPETVYFSSVKDSEEDAATVQYLRDCALQAGMQTKFIYIEDIGCTNTNELVDLQNNPIKYLFKLYPWEFIWDDTYGDVKLLKPIIFFEPPWKMILSNKGILPLLWDRYPNHPNLLPAGVFEGKLTKVPDNFIVKPFLSREGSNISVYTKGKNYSSFQSDDNGYGKEGYIWQRWQQLPNFNGNFPVCGSWIVSGESCGLGIREDKSPITMDTSRFVPHIISD